MQIQQLLSGVKSYVDFQQQNHTPFINDITTLKIKGSLRLNGPKENCEKIEIIVIVLGGYGLQKVLF